MFSQLILGLSALAAVTAAPTPADDPNSHYKKAEAAARAAVGKLTGLNLSERGNLTTRGGAGSVVTNSVALNTWYNPTLNAGAAGVSPSNSYTCFSGSASSFPTHDKWMNFYNLFDLNQQQAMSWTSGNGHSADTGEQQGEVYNAIVSVSQAAKVDPRLILATIIQESGGFVWVQCTGDQHQNCGLMQADFGSVSYNPGSSTAQSQASINQMVTDGTQGTSQGLGLVQYLNGVSYTNCQAGNPYAALRAYNSGECSTKGNLNCAQYGTPSYVNDIANRLIGWDGTNSPEGKCNFPAVGCT